MEPGNRLEGKVAVVTGAASGIGQAAARLFHAEGAAIVAADRDGDRVRALATELGGKAVVGDVGLRESWPDVLNAARQLGGLDVAFLNAGTATGNPDIATLSDEEYRGIMGVNVDQMVYGIRSLVPEMRSQGGGSIIATASLAGIVAFAADPVYTMTKHAVIGLVRGLAPRLADDGITINAICPGLVDTPLIDGAVRDALVGSGFPLLRAEDVAEAAFRCLTEDWTGRAVVVQVGLEPTPYRYARPPGPRDPSILGKVPPGWLGDAGS